MLCEKRSLCNPNFHAIAAMFYIFVLSLVCQTTQMPLVGEPNAEVLHTGRVIGGATQGLLRAVLPLKTKFEGPN